ncbi:hypothetical protein ACF0H5_012211 [Mactra antiquata]
MKTFTTFFTDNCCNIENTLEKFWNIEHCYSESKSLSSDEIKTVEMTEKSLTCEKNFYKVSLPWKDNKELLCNNYIMSLNCLKSTKKWLKNNSELYETYDRTISDYIDKGYEDEIGMVNVRGETVQEKGNTLQDQSRSLYGELAQSDLRTEEKKKHLDGIAVPELSAELYLADDSAITVNIDMLLEDLGKDVDVELLTCGPLSADIVCKGAEVLSVKIEN